MSFFGIDFRIIFRVCFFKFNYYIIIWSFINGLGDGRGGSRILE